MRRICHQTRRSIRIICAQAARVKPSPRLINSGGVGVRCPLFKPGASSGCLLCLGIEITWPGGMQPSGRVEVEPRINVEHVARAVVYMATLPLDANVQFMTVMATKMPYIGRG